MSSGLTFTSSLSAPGVIGALPAEVADFLYAPLSHRHPHRSLAHRLGAARVFPVSLSVPSEPVFWKQFNGTRGKERGWRQTGVREIFVKTAQTNGT